MLRCLASLQFVLGPVLSCRCRSAIMSTHVTLTLTPALRNFVSASDSNPSSHPTPYNPNPDPNTQG